MLHIDGCRFRRLGCRFNQGLQVSVVGLYIFLPQVIQLILIDLLYLLGLEPLEVVDFVLIILGTPGGLCIPFLQPGAPDFPGRCTGPKSSFPSSVGSLALGPTLVLDFGNFDIPFLVGVAALAGQQGVHLGSEFAHLVPD